MINEIKYGGLSVIPSDYECQDGELATAINLITEDGHIRPLAPPSIVLRLVQRYKVVYIHRTSAFTHYILLNDEEKTMAWMDEKDIDSENQYPLNPPAILHSFSSQSVSHINALGNTLMAFSSNGIHYFLWKSDRAGYMYLGDEMPECPISFGLQAEMIRGEEFSITFDNIEENKKFDEFSDNNKKRITEPVLAQVNKFIAEETVNKGRFIYPFFVRYAYRLYDGTLIKHSAPVLMYTCSDYSPQVLFTNLNGKGTDHAINQATLRVFAAVHKLDRQIFSQEVIDRLQPWADIIKSVDIFISAPLYSYDQNGQCKRFCSCSIDGTGDCYSICKHVNQAVDENRYPVRYQYNPWSKMYAFTFEPANLSWPWARVELPHKSEDEIKRQIKETSLFYLLESLKIENLDTKRTVIEIKNDYLQSLVTRERLEDDYDSHDRLVADYSFVYNQRLNVAGLKKYLFQGFHPFSFMPYTNGYVNHYSNENDPLIGDRCIPLSFTVFIRQDGKEFCIDGQTYAFSNRRVSFFFYYPNTNAYKVRFYQGGYMADMALEKHDFLNGAFCWIGWGPVVTKSWQEDDDIAITPPGNRFIGLPNKIYTSEVGNPFFFPLAGINIVGTGSIMGICSAVKALSQGQFGQFPLYAFTTEGVWALEVSVTGSFSARQPVTRDVCINPDGITQIDSAVLFPTDRGIMLISGSQTQCISEAINSEYPFNVLELPGFDKLHDRLGHVPATDKCLPLLPFTQYLRQCRMIYDYVHQHVVVYVPGITYAYVFSLKSKQWGMAYSNIASHLNAYPEALAVDNDNNIVNFSVPDKGEVKCLYVTRPLKLDAANIYKTVDTVIQRGFFRKGHVTSVLYGSRDLQNWYLVWSSIDHYLRSFRGTPYKYFRIAGLATLDTDENIHGASVQFTQRLTNRPR